LNTHTQQIVVVLVSSPPIQLVKKSVKGALRKRNQPLEESNQDTTTEGPSKKKRTADALDDVPVSSSSKRVKVNITAKSPSLEHSVQKKIESVVFKPITSPSKARKQYRGKKAKGSSSKIVTVAAVTDAEVDYDEIPDIPSSLAKPTNPAKDLGASKIFKKNAGKPERSDSGPVSARATRSNAARSTGKKATTSRRKSRKDAGMDSKKVEVKGVEKFATVETGNSNNESVFATSKASTLANTGAPDVEVLLL
jgi:hypothetical protein